MSDLDERTPRRVDTISLRSGIFIVEYFDEPNGVVTAEARGPLVPDAPGAPPADGRLRLVAAAEGSDDDRARTELWKILRAFGEFPWATRADAHPPLAVPTVAEEPPRGH